ncbi:MAG: hypothetical protein M1825_003264 [Sarcosagium campestre]|nr:MAG: hypothetical protein M1825_003264 [Sarcosagium campestre]
MSPHERPLLLQQQQQQQQQLHQQKSRTAPTTGPPGQKLRSSCDGCHVAKVKCIPAGPQQTCSRCLSHNVPCSYSPSLRVGKPRGTKHGQASITPSLSTSTSSSSTTSSSTSTPSTLTFPRPRRPSANVNAAAAAAAAAGSSIAAGVGAGAGSELDSCQSSSSRRASRRVSRASTAGTSHASSDDCGGGGGLDDAGLGTNSQQHHHHNGAGCWDDSASSAAGDAYGQHRGRQQQMAYYMPTPSTSSSGLTTTSSSYDNLRPLWTEQNYFQPNANASLADPYDRDASSIFWPGGAMDHVPSSVPEEAEVESLAGVTLFEQATSSIGGDDERRGSSSSFLLGDGGDSGLAKGTPPHHQLYPQQNHHQPQQQQQQQQYHDGRGGCNCLMPLLQALQIPPHVNKAAAAPGKTGSAVAAFDVLLATNQQAIGRCVAMLGCASCFGSSTSFLLISALLNQTLALYQSACEVYLARPSAATNGGGEAPVAPSSMRLTLGAYRIEEEDEGLLKKELVLIELRKVESLLSRFRHQIGQVEDRSESDTYEALLSYLTRHLHQIVAVIQPRR